MYQNCQNKNHDSFLLVVKKLNIYSFRTHENCFVLFLVCKNVLQKIQIKHLFKKKYLIESTK